MIANVYFATMTNFETENYYRALTSVTVCWQISCCKCKRAEPQIPLRAATALEEIAHMLCHNRGLKLWHTLSSIGWHHLTQTISLQDTTIKKHTQCQQMQCHNVWSSRQTDNLFIWKQKPSNQKHLCQRSPWCKICSCRGIDFLFIFCFPLEARKPITDTVITPSSNTESVNQVFVYKSESTQPLQRNKVCREWDRQNATYHNTSALWFLLQIQARLQH